MTPKFRAWDTWEKEMLENVTPLFDDSNSMIGIITDFQIKGSPGTSEIEIGSYDTTLNWDDFPYILMQYTGLKDKNGVKIYEGDVVLLNVNNGFDFVDNEAFVVQKSLYHSGLVCAGNSEMEYRIFNKENVGGYSYEVIGNIHENPELLSEV